MNNNLFWKILFTSTSIHQMAQQQEKGEVIEQTEYNPFYPIPSHEG